MTPIEAGVTITEHLKKSASPAEAKYAIVEALTAAEYSTQQIIDIILEAAKKLEIETYDDVDYVLQQLWVELREVKNTFVWQTTLGLVAKYLAQAAARILIKNELAEQIALEAIEETYQRLFGKEGKE